MKLELIHKTNYIVLTVISYWQCVNFIIRGNAIEEMKSQKS